MNQKENKVKASYGRRGAISVLAFVILGAATVAPAQAQDAPGVTLEASRSVIDLGEQVHLKGETNPPSENETIVIMDEEGNERAETTTDASGRYRITLSPRRSTEFRARWLAAVSDGARVKVRPKVTVGLRGIRLFGRARLKGTVAPAQEETKARVTLYRSGTALWTRRLSLADGRRFSAAFKVDRPGTYRAVARVTDPAGATGRDRSASIAPPLPSLSPGARSIYVKLLKRRLQDLRHHVDGVNRSFTTRTSDAVIAFNKVRRRARSGMVDADTWRALAAAGRPKPRYSSKGLHVEIDQTRQIVMTVRKGKVTRVLHTSTGRNGYTRDGKFKVYRKLAGYSPGRLYYPAYFDGLRAFHGWPDVPTYPASHGCARLPMWTARWIFNQVSIGTVVRVYH